MAGPDNIATLSVRFQSIGADQVKADAADMRDAVVRSANEIGASVDQTAQSYQRWRAQNDQLTASQRDLVARMDAALEAARGLTGANEATTASVKAQIDAVRAQATIMQQTALIEQDLIAAETLLGNRYTSNREIALAHAEAIEMTGIRYQDSREIALAHVAALEMDAEVAKVNAAANEQAAASVNLHGLQLGRMSTILGTAEGRMLGMASGVGRFGALLGNATVGAGGMVGILAVIGGLTWVWDKLTEGAKKAEEQQKKNTAALDEYLNKLRRPAGDLGAAATDLAERVAQEQKQYNQLKAQRDSLMAQDAGGGGADSHLEAANALNNKMIELNKTLTLHEAQLKAVQPEVNRLTDAYTNTAALAELNVEKINALTNATGEDAIEIAKINIHYELRAKLLQDAAQYTGEQLKQMDAIAEREAAALIRQAELNERQKDRMALLEQIGTVAEKTAPEWTINRRAFEEQVASLQVLNEALTKLPEIAAHAQRQAQQQINESVKAIKDAQDYQDQIQKVWRESLERIVSHGTKSYHDFFGDVLSMFSKLMDDMEKEAKKRGELNATGFEHAALGGASSAIAGGLAGFQIGETAKNAGMGALGGAASGAMIGNEILPGWGAAIGALAGAAGGLFGAAAEHKKAAEALQKAAEAVQFSLLQYNVKAGMGGTTSLDVSLAQNHAEANKLADAIDAALPGLKNQIEREKDLAQVRADETAITAQLTAADAQAKAVLHQNLEARLLAAQGDVTEAAAVRQMIADQKELDSATKDYGASSAQVAELLAVQAAEAQQRARDLEREHENRADDLRVRQLYAQGLNDEADLLKRQVAERKEVDDALKQGWTTDEIAALKLTQAMEDQKAAADKAAAATEKLAESTASLTSRYLNAIGQTEAAALNDLLEKQRKEVYDAQQGNATPTQLAMIAVVQDFERAQVAVQQQNAAMQKTLEAQLKVQQDQLNTAKQQLQADTQAEQTFSKYRDSLATSSLSALSPQAQLAAAKAQRDALFARASSGDASAASEYTSADQTFLQLDRQFYGSGQQYANDFAQSQSQATALAKEFADRKSLDQQMVDSLQKQVDLLQQQITALTDAKAVAEQTKQAVIDGFNKQLSAALAVNGPLIDQFASLRDTLTGVGAQIAGVEHDTLLGDQNAFRQATQAEIDAIRNGASAQQVAQLELARQIAEQATTSDDKAAQQIASLLGLREQFGATGRALVDAQTATLTADQAALRDLGSAEVDAIKSGASASQIALIDQARQIEALKTVDDANFAKQIAETSKIYGPDSSQTKALVDLQKLYDDKAQTQIDRLKDQIDATKSIGGDITGAIGRISFAPTGPAVGTHPTSPTPPGFGPGTSPVGTPTSPGIYMLWDPFTLTTYPNPSDMMSFTDPKGNVWKGPPPGTWTPKNDDGLLGHKTSLDPTGVLGFANGGDFGGGLRLVGERGPELELTGPSRIVNTNDLGSLLASGKTNSEAQTAAIQRLEKKLETIISVLVESGTIAESGFDTVANHLEQGNKEAARARRKAI